MKKTIYFLLFLLCCNIQVMAQSKVTIMKDFKKYGAVYLGNFDETIRADRKIVLAAVQAHGDALEYAVNALKRDKEIVIAAVEQYGLALQYAHESLKKDKEVLLAAVKSNGNALEYAHENLKKDKEVVLRAVKFRPYTIKYADKSLQQDKAFLAQIEKQKLETLAQINKPSKTYKGKIYKAKKRTCWQYNASGLIAWNSWVAPGKKHLAKDEVKSIKEVYIWIKKQTKKEKQIALVTKVADRVYRHNFIFCHKEKDRFSCGGECDSGQMQLGKGMQLHLETLDFIVEDMSGARAELVLEQRQKEAWLQPKTVTCPEYVTEGLNVCYEKKIIKMGIKYDGCIRSHAPCDKIGKMHFGSYPNEESAESAYHRCEQNRPNK